MPAACTPAICPVAYRRIDGSAGRASSIQALPCCHTRKKAIQATAAHETCCSVLSETRKRCACRDKLSATASMRLVTPPPPPPAGCPPAAPLESAGTGADLPASLQTAVPNTLLRGAIRDASRTCTQMRASGKRAALWPAASAEVPAMLPVKKRRLDQAVTSSYGPRPAAASALHCELMRFAEEATPTQVRLVTACIGLH